MVGPLLSSYETRWVILNRNILSLFQEASNVCPSLDPANLSVQPPAHYEVVNGAPQYRQYLRYENSKIQLLTPNFTFDHLIVKQHLNELDHSVLIPVMPWLRQQFNVIETFVQQNADFSQLKLPTPYKVNYKPLWSGDMMYIRVSRWCQIFKQNLETGQFDTVNIKERLGQGTFNVTIEVPYIFFGPHKNGENFSLTIRIDQIVFIPDKPRPNIITYKTPDVKGGRRRKNAAQDKEARTWTST